MKKKANIPIPADVRLLSKAEVLERVGLTFPSVWRMMREGRFPAARTLGNKPAWVESEITAFIEKLPVRRYKGAA